MVVATVFLVISGVFWVCGTRSRGSGAAPAAQAARIQAILRTDYLHQLPLVEDAFGRQSLALLRVLDTAATNADDLAAATIEHFDKHPEVEIVTSLPGLGSLTGARVLAEIGDDRSRFTTARSLKAYAGSAPVTRASSTGHTGLESDSKRPQALTTLAAGQAALRP